MEKKPTNYNIRNEKRISLEVQGILKYNSSITNDFKHREFEDYLKELEIPWKIQFIK